MEILAWLFASAWFVVVARSAPFTASSPPTRLRPAPARNEKLGTYDPLVEENGLNLDEERVKYWLGVGASPSETVAGLIKKAGIEA